MQGTELSQLAIADAVTDGDLEAMIHVRRLVTPEARPAVENLRHNLESKEKLDYVVARIGDEPVACGFVEPWGSVAGGDIAVVPAQRRRGVGSAMLAELSRRARGFGRDSIQGEVKESDTESRAFLERRGFEQVGAEKALVLELEGREPPEIAPPPGVRIVSRAGVQTFEEWRAQEIDKPSKPPELCFLALAGDEVVGYAALHAFGDECFHALTATRRDWRRRGVASALKRAEIAAVIRSGRFGRLLTESEERNEPMRRLNEKLGFVPAPEYSTIVMRGPLAQ